MNPALNPMALIAMNAKNVQLKKVERPAAKPPEKKAEPQPFVKLNHVQSKSTGNTSNVTKQPSSEILKVKKVDGKSRPISSPPHAMNAQEVNGQGNSPAREVPPAKPAQPVQSQASREGNQTSHSHTNPKPLQNRASIVPIKVAVFPIKKKTEASPQPPEKVAEPPKTEEQTSPTPVSPRSVEKIEPTPRTTEEPPKVENIPPPVEEPTPKEATPPPKQEEETPKEPATPKQEVAAKETPALEEDLSPKERKKREKGKFLLLIWLMK